MASPVTRCRSVVAVVLVRTGVPGSREMKTSTAPLRLDEKRKPVTDPTFMPCIVT